MAKLVTFVILSSVLVAAGLATNRPREQNPADTASLDQRVQNFLNSHRGSFRDLNVPEADGKALYDVIVQHRYKNALEIGTSTGYSGLWIAWALSKTGGKLTTIEIEKYRHEEALAYFREAGLAKYIDARLGDAHEIVPALQGPFDFVFCDADKDWYTQYLKAVLPKLSTGGCFAAHNITDYAGGGRERGRRSWSGDYADDYLEYARGIPSLDTKVLDIQGSVGLAVSYKK
jgi:caffeoyl-CoA O-methyltransferase